MKWLNPKTYIKLIIGKVIVRKVVGKLLKHAATVLSGFIVAALTSSWFIQYGQPILDVMDIQINQGSLEAGLTVLFGGMAGALINFLQHRFLK